MTRVNIAINARIAPEANQQGLAGERWLIDPDRGDCNDYAVTKRHELVTRGPYRYVRHPIYSAILAMFLATALAIGQLGALVGFVLCFASFWIKLRQEEALMMRHFPNEYPAYRARVKALVPFVI